MRRKLTKLLLALLLFGGLLVYGSRVAVVSAFHADACHVIALEIASQSEVSALSGDEICNLISGLIRASVIHGEIDANDKPTDLNGNPFVIQRDEKQVVVSTQRSLWQPLVSRQAIMIDSRFNVPHSQFRVPTSAQSIGLASRARPAAIVCQ